MGLFSQFLFDNKAKFLQDLKNGNIEQWTIVMGNEAGDLDTVASSTAYAYLASKLRNTPTVPVILTPRKDFYLRPENLEALKLAELDSEQRDLLCIDDFPLSSISSANFVLVDHNSLLSAFQGKGKVVGIIDHHADEGHHLDANFREIVTPVGSCASLVAKHFKDSWSQTIPSEMATFLLSAIHIDTNGLKPNKKAVPIDYDASAFLYPVSTFTQTTGSLQGDIPNIRSLASELRALKSDVAHLSTRDLLRRDYKQYNFGGSQIGLATVPFGLKAWLKKDREFWDGLEAFVTERGISILGVLTSFKGGRKETKKREILMLVDDKVVPGQSEKRLFKGLKASEALELETKDSVEVPDNLHARAWKQANAKASRKVIAPLVEDLLTGDASSL